MRRLAAWRSSSVRRLFGQKTHRSKSRRDLVEVLLLLINECLDLGPVGFARVERNVQCDRLLREWAFGCAVEQRPHKMTPNSVIQAREAVADGGIVRAGDQA